MLNLAISAITKLYYAMLEIANCVSKVGHLQLVFTIQNVAILYTISRQIAISTNTEN